MAIEIKSPISPIGDRVVLRKLETKDVSAGGIILSDKSDKSGNYALIVATGEDANERIKIGGIAIIGKYAGVDVRVKRETYLVARSEEILGLVSDAEMAAEMFNEGVTV